MKITIVNMIKPSLSGETHHDTEPNIAVNPANVQQIAGTAFSLDPMGGSQGPVYVSVDEGNTWDEPDLLPTQTGDQTIRFAGTSNILYAAILDPSVNMKAYRKNDITAPGLMTQIYNLAGSYPIFCDQPYIQAATVMGGSGVNSDRVYIGGNDLHKSSVDGKTSSIIQSMDSAAGSPVFNQVVIEKRNTPTSPYKQDGPQVRIAIHPDGTVYALIYHWRTDTTPPIVVTADVVLMRDDNWGNSATPYSALLDSSDSIAGQIIANNITFTFNYSVGGQRTAGDLNVAVDPRDSSTVYVAWAELLSSVYTIHLVRSDDRGANWSSDLLTITNATHPCIAVNSQGKIGFLYQQITGSGSAQRWETHFRSSDDGIMWDDTILCTAFNRGSSGAGPLGDYIHMMAAGKNFYGVFTADNTPDLTNFPATATVIYNRNHDYATQRLLANDNITTVTSSVDPFFFKIEEIDPDKDFYIRDWTNNASDHDLGQEPSTYPWFYQKSDVWNSNSNSPGSIVDDWYQGDDPTAGTSTLGDNYAFTRISRNDASTAANVDVEFLSSDYGLGIPYASVGSQTINFAVGDLSKLTDGQLWHLDPTASTHACLAAQINTADDPLIAPGLSGSVPGWPFPDLLVINDNNKAQRNLHVNHVAAGMFGTAMLRIRNAALQTRDAHIRYDVPKIKWPIPRSRVEVLGGESEVFKSGEIIILKNMKPGENRWLSFSFDSVKAVKGMEVPVNFYELNGNQVVNGCTVLLRNSTIEEAIKSTLNLQRSVYNRINAIGIKVNPEAIKQNNNLFKSKQFKPGYLKSGALFHATLIALIEGMYSDQGNFNNLNFEKDLKTISSKISSANLVKFLSAQTILLKKLDSALTMKLLSQGDLACILSNVNWQISLYSTNKNLSGMKSTTAMLKHAEKFALAYPFGKVTNNDYPGFLKNALPCLKETADNLSRIKAGLKKSIDDIERSTGSLRGLQKAHYDFLLQLSDYFENK
jgi:hypothetical protein